MPALEIDPAALAAEGRKELDLLLAGPKILAEPGGRRGALVSRGSIAM